MQSVKTIRVLERALDVLERLEERDATLAELVAGTGLPKASLMRILRTLEEHGRVRRTVIDMRWQLRARGAGSRRLPWRHQRLAELALPHLERLRAAVVWPSDIAVRRRTWMELLETNRPRSGLSLNRDPLGHRIDLLRSAVGRAYLAFAPEAERARLLDALAGRLAAVASSRRAFEAALEVIRREGYASRTPDYGGANVSIDRFDDRLDAIAVPIRVPPLQGVASAADAPVAGCINIVFPRRLLSPRAVAAQHLQPLQQAADSIAAELQAAATAARAAAPPRD